MAYDEGLVQRVRECLEPELDFSEKRMFGGVAFLLRGNMCVGVIGEELMVRVGPKAYPDAVALDHARAMDFTGRPMKGFVFVSAAGIETDADLATWIARGLEFSASLPAK